MFTSKIRNKTKQKYQKTDKNSKKEKINTNIPAITLTVLK
jgi:hypothetical protein